MKSIIVISDSHGNRTAIDKLFPVFKECDYIIHLGDLSSDGQYIKKTFGDKVYLLNGNCDFMKLGQDELTLEIEGVKILACHGDRYGAKYGYDRLAYRAEELGCNVALFGHTHQAVEFTIDGVTLFNPGTLSRYSQNSYLFLALNDGKAVGKIVEINA
ncbi:MAG: YfcE family phosphodiesterase [Candidatus Coproplasma sp.]